MKRLLSLAWLAAMAILPVPGTALAGHAEYDALVAKHAKANAVPEVLVHRVIVRESRYRPDLVGRGGTIGLMQIKLATARSLGYTGDAEGLRDPDTNVLYGVKYLAGAYRVANGDHTRAMHYYASGYYYQAKQQRLERVRVEGLAGPVLASAPPKGAVKPDDAATLSESAKPEAAAATPVENPKPQEATAAPAEIAEPKDAAAKPAASAKPKLAAAKKPKHARKNLAEAEARVPRPPVNLPSGANATKPR
jgi:Transglycosylase SLT domain